MAETVGVCCKCDKSIFCFDGFLNGVILDKQLYCFECDGHKHHENEVNRITSEQKDEI